LFFQFSDVEFVASHTGNHPQEDLAKFDYKADTKAHMYIFESFDIFTYW
jgi:hypothetical protein